MKEWQNPLGVLGSHVTLNIDPEEVVTFVVCPQTIVRQ